MKSFDKQPCIRVPGFDRGHSFEGYGRICAELRQRLQGIKKERRIIAIEFYPGVRTAEIEAGIISSLDAALTIYADEDVFYDAAYVTEKLKGTMTDDRVFAVMTHYKLEDFIDWNKMELIRNQISRTKGIVVLYGVGASLIADPDILVYADMARWEIQNRQRRGELKNWKQTDDDEDGLKKFKWGYFFEWRIGDRQKKTLFERMDYLLDSNLKDQPRMITGESYQAGLRTAVASPFRLAPFFDPGVWGGQWLKETCDLDRDQENYAWAFDCVPEENSLLFEIGGTIVETPAINLVFVYPQALLGEKNYARFGDEFPIRFDLLDTMGGQNLSLQVHPTKAYIYENFGMSYTQDESYYILEAKEDAVVYLGLQTGIQKDKFLADLEKGDGKDYHFPVEQYINQIPARKHDHFLIPAGTVHCSGKDTVVLEISATPYIFTFKLWDWDRLGLDGCPRPVHIQHGKKVIEYNRDTKWIYENVVNQIEEVDWGDGWREERTGLHELEFIETRRHWFYKPVTHNTNGGVNVISLVEGDACIVESPTGSFEPFEVHYAETFIVPAAVGEYIIRPYGESVGKEIGTLKAYVR